MIEIEPVVAGPLETIGYLVSDETNKAVIIDTPMDSTPGFMKIIHQKGLHVEGIILTHTHWDHTADAAELKRQTGAKVYVHEKDAYRLDDPNKFTVMRLPFDFEPVKADVLLKGGETIEFGNSKLDVLFTPGHSEGGICLVNETGKVVFSGDTLFNGSYGRYDFPGGSLPLLVQSIAEKLLTLPADFTVYCGHGDSTSIGNEMHNNPICMHIIDGSL